MASSSSRGSVALVTLGCTRNEVDSEELAGRLAAEGWTLVDDAADADVAVVNTCGFVEQAKKDSIDTLLEAADLKQTGRTRGGRRRRLPRRALRPDPGRRAAGCRRGARLRLLPRHVQPPHRHPRWRAPGIPRALRPAHAAAAVAGRPLAGRGRRGVARPRRRRAVRALAARRPALGAAEDRQRLRPAVLVLRDPDVPRVVRLAAPHRRARRGALAGAAGRARAVPGLARTPPPTARTSATSRCSRSCCPS